MRLCFMAPEVAACTCKVFKFIMANLAHDLSCSAACTHAWPKQAASEDEMRVSLGLANYTTGKGKVALSEINMRPIEVFMCSVVRTLCSKLNE